MRFIYKVLYDAYMRFVQDRSISVMPCLTASTMYEASATTSGTGLAMKWIFS